MTQGPWRRAITTVLAVTGLATATNWVLKHVFRMKDREATAASGTTPAQPARPNWGRRIAAWGLAIGGLFALPLLGKRTGLLNSDRARVTPGTTPAGTPPAALGSSPERHDTRVQEDVSVRPGGDFQDTGVAVVDATTTNIQIAPVGSRTPRVIAITALAGNAEVAVPEHGLVIRRNANVIQVKVTDPSKVGTTVNIGAFGAGPSPVTWQRLDVEGETEPPADQIQGEYVADNRRRIIDIPEATGGAPRQRVFTLNNPDAVVTVEGRTVENRAGNVIPHPDFPGATLTIDRSGAQLTFKPALTGAAVGQRIHWGVWVGGRKYNIGVAR